MILLELVTKVWLFWLSGFSGEKQAHCSVSEKSFNYVNGGGVRAFCQKLGLYILELRSWLKDMANSLSPN